MVFAWALGSPPSDASCLANCPWNIISFPSLQRRLIFDLMSGAISLPLSLLQFELLPSSFSWLFWSPHSAPPNRTTTSTILSSFSFAVGCSLSSSETMMANDPWPALMVHRKMTPRSLTLSSLPVMLLRFIGLESSAHCSCVELKRTSYVTYNFMKIMIIN